MKSGLEYYRGWVILIGAVFTVLIYWRKLN